MSRVQTPTSFVLSSLERAVPDIMVDIPMKRLALFFLISAFALLLSGCDTYEYDFYGNISGTVTDYADNSPLEGASVLLMPGSKTVTTSSDGTFMFEDIAAGKYTISAQKSGYQSDRKTVEISSGEDVSTAVSLKRIPE